MPRRIIVERLPPPVAAPRCSFRVLRMAAASKPPTVVSHTACLSLLAAVPVAHAPLARAWCTARRTPEVFRTSALILVAAFLL
jgi:hypothetical protein